MRLFPLFAGLLLAAAFSGCIGGGSDEPSTPGADGSTGKDGDDGAPPELPDENLTDEANETLPGGPLLSYTGCRVHLGGYPVQPSDVQRYVPSGFRPAPFAENTSTASALVFAMTCPTVVSANETVGSTEMWLNVLVIPPAEMQNGSIDGFYVPVRILSSTPNVTAAYGALGFPVADSSSVSLSRIDVGSAEQGDFTMGAEGLRVSVDTATANPAPADPFRIRFYTVADGAVTGAVDFEVARTPRLLTGASTLEFEQGTNLFGNYPRLAGLGVHYVWGSDDVGHTVWKMTLEEIGATAF